jgi:hypothetical protein
MVTGSTTTATGGTTTARGKGQQGVRRHDNADGQHDDGKGQQGDMRHDDGDGRHDEWSSARSQSVVTRMAIKILIMKIYSRFKGTDLSRSMLANFVMPQRRDRGAMAAMGRRRPPWSGYIFLPSFRLANHVSEVCQPKNQQKTNLNIWLNGTFEVPILCEFIGRRCMWYG